MSASNYHGFFVSFRLVYYSFKQKVCTNRLNGGFRLNARASLADPGPANNNTSHDWVNITIIVSFFTCHFFIRKRQWKNSMWNYISHFRVSMKSANDKWMFIPHFPFSLKSKNKVRPKMIGLYKRRRRRLNSIFWLTLYPQNKTQTAGTDRPMVWRNVTLCIYRVESDMIWSWYSVQYTGRWWTCLIMFR